MARCRRSSGLDQIGPTSWREARNRLRWAPRSFAIKQGMHDSIATKCAKSAGKRRPTITLPKLKFTEDR